MLSRDGSRSMLTVLLAGTLGLVSIASALGQAVPTPPGAAPTASPPLPFDSDAPVPAQPGTTPRATIVPAPAAPTTNAPPQANTPPPNSVPPADTGTLYAYSLASVPDMMGDSPSGGHYNVFPLTVNFGGRDVTIPIAGGDGYAKIADDSSPIPTDRVFFDDNYFNHAVRTGNGGVIGLNRFTFGVEKTFFDGRCSIEVEAPVDTGLSSYQDLDATTGENQGTVFGNLSLTFKCLIYQSESLAVSVGTMVDLPTAPDASFNFEGETLTFKNNSVHVAPFLGAAYASGDFFALGFVQLDFDANGDPVDEEFEDSDPVIGTFRDPSLLYLDLSTGYWLFRNQPISGRYLTGIAPVVELHYTTTLQNYSGINGAIVPVYAGTDCLNLTAGLHFQLGPCSMLTVSGVVPLLTSDRDKEFDSEVLMQFDRRF